MQPFHAILFVYSAVNSENDEVNNIRNQDTGAWGGVPDTARDYKVIPLPGSIRP